MGRLAGYSCEEVVTAKAAINIEYNWPELSQGSRGWKHDEQLVIDGSQAEEDAFPCFTAQKPQNRVL